MLEQNVMLPYDFFKCNFFLAFKFLLYTLFFCIFKLTGLHTLIDLLIIFSHKINGKNLIKMRKKTR